MFRFDRDFEVRYMAGIPDSGDLVTHGSELWVVLHVRIDADGTTVVCHQPNGGRAPLRRVA
jgi:hypothetical protein